MRSQVRGGRVWVEVTRGEAVESVHEVEVAVVDDDGRAVAWAGRTEEPVFTRSAIKPLQALPLVADGVVERFGITEEELALCCASHSGEARHVALARSLLDRIGLDEAALACGPHEPFHRESARALRESGRAPGRVHNNCSGKHAGMLALARTHDWPIEGYQLAGHPVQERVKREVERWSGVDGADIPTGVDGCGVVTFAVPLSGVARAFARLAADGAGPAARVLDAMGRHPDVVGGTGRLCTAVIQATAGRVIAKVGAEGVYAVAARDRGWGMGVKVRDGAPRAVEPALVAVLDALEWIQGAQRRMLDRWLRPVIRNTRDEAVGEIRARVELAGPGGTA